MAWQSFVRLIAAVVGQELSSGWDSTVEYRLGVCTDLPRWRVAHSQFGAQGRPPSGRRCVLAPLGCYSEPSGVAWAPCLPSRGLRNPDAHACLVSGLPVLSAPGVHSPRSPLFWASRALIHPATSCQGGTGPAGEGYRHRGLSTPGQMQVQVSAWALDGAAVVGVPMPHRTHEGLLLMSSGLS